MSFFTTTQGLFWFFLFSWFIELIKLQYSLILTINFQYLKLSYRFPPRGLSVHSPRSSLCLYFCFAYLYWSFLVLLFFLFFFYNIFWCFCFCYLCCDFSRWNDLIMRWRLEKHMFLSLWNSWRWNMTQVMILKPIVHANLWLEYETFASMSEDSVFSYHFIPSGFSVCTSLC